MEKSHPSRILIGPIGQSQLVCLSLAMLWASQGWAAPAEAAGPGDRRPEIRRSYPESAFFHAGKGGRLIDVTKPPFNARGDGKADDTGALIAAMDYVQRVRREGYCGRRLDVGSYLLYLPDGTYRVSDTISRSLPVRVGAPPYDNYRQYWVMDEKELEDRDRFPVGKFSNEQNDTIVVLGESREGTTLQLDDNCPGFGPGQSKPVLAFFRFTCGSNVNQDNVLENLTIDTGRGNPGAVGVRWNSSNTGAIRNTTIRSGDGAGATGLLCDVRNAEGLIENLTISGFDVGWALTSGAATAVAVDGATFSNQRTIAVRVANASNLSARRVLMENSPVGLKLESAAHAVLLDSVIRCPSGGGVGIEMDASHLLVRDVSADGCGVTIVRDGQPLVSEPVVREFVSGPVVAVDAARPPTLAEPLAVEETPLVMPDHGAGEWANVDDFGAVGDGETDDTAAIQRAMDSGKPAVLFPREVYTINGTVRIPKSIKKISFLYGKTLRAESADGAMFTVAEASPEPLLIEQNINFGGILLDHEAERPVVLADSTTYFPHSAGGNQPIHEIMPRPFAAFDPQTNCWRLYRNTTPQGAPKKLFVNNCVNFAPGGPQAMHAVENVHVWCRQVNTEHYGVDLAFRRSRAWILSFKTEMDGTHFWAEDGSQLEVLGGVYYQGGPNNEAPVVVARDSGVRVTMSSFGGGSQPAQTILEDRKGEQTTLLGRELFPLLRPSNPEMPVVPLMLN